MFKALNRPTLIRALSTKASKGSSGKATSSPSPAKVAPPPSTSNAKNIDGSVPGLSNRVLSVPDTEVGPGASKKSNYKNPEYFTYHAFSYAEAEVEMFKFRLPQPSSKAK